MSIPKYPSNRQTKPQRGEVKPVVTNQTRMRKTSNLANNVRNVSNGLFEEVILPAIKGMLADFFTQGIRSVIFGNHDTGGYARPSYGQPYRRAYHAPYVDRGGPTRIIRSEERYGRQSMPSSQNIGDVVFSTREDAENVLGQMQVMIHDFGMVTVGDLYSLAGLGTPNHTYQRWGWTNLSGTPIESIGGGEYIIGFPGMEFFNL